MDASDPAEDQKRRTPRSSSWRDTTQDPPWRATLRALPYTVTPPWRATTQERKIKRTPDPPKFDPQGRNVAWTRYWDDVDQEYWYHGIARSGPEVTQWSWCTETGFQRYTQKDAAKADAYQHARGSQGQPEGGSESSSWSDSTRHEQKKRTSKRNPV